MEFSQTGLPDRKLLRTSFVAGFERCVEVYGAGAGALYAAGPAKLARLVYDRGGDCHQNAVAAALAGPAVFTRGVAGFDDEGVHILAQEIMMANALRTEDLPHLTVILSQDARLFLQASAVCLLEALVPDTPFGDEADRTEARTFYTEAMTLYSLMRGTQDRYHMDTMCEIAAMKVTAALEDKAHIWVRAENNNSFKNYSRAQRT